MTIQRTRLGVQARFSDGENCIVKQVRIIAKVKRDCNACDWLRGYLDDNLSDFEIPFSEAKSIIRARRDGWSILPGQAMIKTFGRFEGQWGVWYSRPDIDELNRHYNFYEY